MEPRPEDDRASLLNIDKKWSAVRQLETALFLWFDYGDPVSIHTLSKAANDLFAALSDKKAERVSTLKTWLESQSQSIQDVVRDVDNFFKHGYRDFEKELDFSPFYTQIVMLDSVDCHAFLYGQGTPIMRLFSTRFLMCNPDFLGPTQSKSLVLEGINVYGLDKIDRREFFKKLWPAFSSGAANESA